MTSSLHKTYGNKIIDKITDFDNDNQSLGKQISNQTSTLSDESEDDYTQRQLCIEAVKKCKTALTELTYLKGYVKNTEDNNAIRAWRYLDTSDINLNNYFPDTGSDVGTIEDLSGGWDMFYAYSSSTDRTSYESLKHDTISGDYSDDDYDLNTKHPEWISLPYGTDLLKIDYDEESKSIYGYLRALYNLLNNKYIYSFTELAAKSTTSNISSGSDTDGKYVVWTFVSYSSLGISSKKVDDTFFVPYYAYVYIPKTVVDVETVTTETVTTYTTTVKIYYNTKDYLTYNKLFNPPITSTSTNYNSYVTNASTDLANGLNTLYNYIKDLDSEILIDSGTSPKENYYNLYLKANSLSTYTTSQKVSIINNINTYLTNRASVLIANLTDTETITTVNSCMKLRLNKKNGTLLSWYRNVTAIDGSVTDMNAKYMAVKPIFSKLAVWEVKELGDDYVIIEQEVSSWYKTVIGYLPTISVGDIVYVFDDNNAETSTKVKAIETTTVDGDTSVDDDGNTITTTVEAYKVIMYNKLSSSYSTDNELKMIKEL